LEITERHFNNPEQLEEIWNNAFQLAMNYAKDKVNEVVHVLGGRLLTIQKYESAAEMFETVSSWEKAIDAYIQVKKWDRATECAQQVRPAELQEVMMTKIQKHKKESYIAGGKIQKIVEGGDLSGLELLAQSGRWEECLQLASKQSP
jgi:hypothetical protein